jgi:hypothetical protein
VTPIFVDAITAANLCMISRDTWDKWVSTGFAPAPAVDRGQILRWHWPTVEAVLTCKIEQAKENVFVQGARNVGKARAAKARKEGRNRGVA